MTDLRKAAEMALDWFEGCQVNGIDDTHEAAVAAAEALRQALAEPANSTTGFVESKALAQPEQEPVTAHQALEALDELESCARGDEPFNHFAAPLVRQFIEQAVVLPKKEWVGLTDEERSYYLQSAANVGWWQAALFVEAKIKEKNA